MQAFVWHTLFTRSILHRNTFEFTLSVSCFIRWAKITEKHTGLSFTQSLGFCTHIHSVTITLQKKQSHWKKGRVHFKMPVLVKKFQLRVSFYFCTLGLENIWLNTTTKNFLTILKIYWKSWHMLVVKPTVGWICNHFVKFSGCNYVCYFYPTAMQPRTFIHFIQSLAFLKGNYRWATSPLLFWTWHSFDLRQCFKEVI